MEEGVEKRPWCPKCKMEYREGFEICSDCNTELIDELDEAKEDNIPLDKEAFLVSVSGDIEASTIEALLKMHKIPTLRKYREAGGYLEIYMGMSTFSIDLFVPSRCLEEARAIISKDTQDVIVETDNTDSNSFKEIYQKKRRIKTWIILLFFTPGILWFFLTYIIILIQNLIK